jgi:hypothetical protein
VDVTVCESWYDCHVSRVVCLRALSSERFDIARRSNRNESSVVYCKRFGARSAWIDGEHSRIEYDQVWIYDTRNPRGEDPGHRIGVFNPWSCECATNTGSGEIQELPAINRHHGH